MVQPRWGWDAHILNYVEIPVFSTGFTFSRLSVQSLKVMQKIITAFLVER